MTIYSDNITSRTSTPQSETIPGREREMIENNAGGVVFSVDDWTQLDRFLVLGVEGGSYHVGEQKLVRDNAAAPERCLKNNGSRFVKRIVDISTSRRAPKNDPAVFLLAMASKLGDEKTKQLAYRALPEVCRIGTHLFQYVNALKAFGGWGNGTSRALSRWYSNQPLEKLALQVAKYQNREGWTHRDVLRLCHPVRFSKNRSAEFDAVLSWVIKAETTNLMDVGPTRLLWAFERAKSETDPEKIVELIRAFDLPRECLPTEALQHKEVWQALLEKMPPHALLRNLNKMTAVGLFDPFSKSYDLVLEKISEMKGVHPISILIALKTYQSGRGVRGGLTWSPVSQVIDALDSAFYKAFSTVAPTNKRWLLALDVSGSMAGSIVQNIPNLSAREVAAVIAMVIARTEPRHAIVAFASGNGAWLKPKGEKGVWPFYPKIVDGILPISISPRQRLDDIMCETASLSMGGTDCALPMRYALEKEIDCDAFVIITDNETWAGDIHPTQALKKYRDQRVRGAKLAVLATSPTGFSIADPQDSGQLDFVGFDAAVPALLSDFVSDGAVSSGVDGEW